MIKILINLKILTKYLHKDMILKILKTSLSRLHGNQFLLLLLNTFEPIGDRTHDQPHSRRNR